MQRFDTRLSRERIHMSENVRKCPNSKFRLNENRGDREGARREEGREVSRFSGSF